MFNFFLIWEGIAIKECNLLLPYYIDEKIAARVCDLFREYSKKKKRRSLFDYGKW